MTIYSDINGQQYLLSESDKTATIRENHTSFTIEIFPIITYNNTMYEVVFPDDCENLFSNNINLRKVIIHRLLNNIINIKNINYMFSKCSNLKELDLSNFNANIYFMDSAFKQCRSLQLLDISNINTKNVKSMNSLFNGCTSIKELNLSNFNTENVTIMNNMFWGCESLKELYLSSFNTENVERMEGMFYLCKSLKLLNIFSFNTKNVFTMRSMFSYCVSIPELDLRHFDTTNLINTELMFFKCSALKKLYLRNFNIENANNIKSMFIACGIKELNLSSNIKRRNNVLNKNKMIKLLKFLNIPMINFKHFNFKFDKVTNSYDTYIDYDKYCNSIFANCEYPTCVYDVNCNNSYK